jgi:hypothetical protein
MSRGGSEPPTDVAGAAPAEVDGPVDDAADVAGAVLAVVTLAFTVPTRPSAAVIEASIT